MIFKSIKWCLQVWYGLILVLVLAGFGFTAYQLEWGRQMRQVDDELQRRFAVLAGAFRPPPPGPDFTGQPPGHPPPDRLPEEMPRRQNPRPPVDFHLPPMAIHLFDTNDLNGFYFVIQARDGKEIARGGDVPRSAASELARVSKLFPQADFESPEPAADSPKSSPARIVLPDVVIVVHSPANPFKSFLMQTFSAFREVVHGLPSGDSILVGCSITPQLRELHRTALEFGAAGGIILLLGLVGGRWLVERALQPIDEISGAAVKISAGNLSQRINVAETESELGRLAGVLNSTFARLETAFAQQQQFTADAAHELRTPVSVMLTQTQTALQRERGATEYRETIEACQRASQRMRRLIESLLELARLDAGQETLKRTKFDLSQTAWDCMELVRPLAAARGMKIHCDLQPTDCQGDVERLAQVITNLLANAVQYNKDNGEVRISLKRQGSMILLAVSDTGPGISRADLPHVFDRFYRADPSRSSGQTGLGLAISRAIVEAHGGTISVSSQPGTGTTFTVLLPI